MAPVQDEKPLPASVAHIPVLDFGPFLHGTPEEKAAVGKQLTDCFKKIGFIYLKNHGVDDKMLKSVYAKSKAFFDLPEDEKHKSDWINAEANRGYSGPGREKVTQLLDSAEVEKLRSQFPDLKESFEIGKEPAKWDNPWPTYDPEFRTTMMDFFEHCHHLQLKLMSAFALGLGLEEDFFTPFCDKKDHNLRLLHYPSVPKNAFDNESQRRAGEHTDYGTVTLLFQDTRGGLEVKNLEGKYVPATPIEGTIVVNAGDLLQRWSNDVIKSTEHRVVSPTEEVEGDAFPARYTVVYFSNPNNDAMIEVLDACATESKKKYEPINALDYLVMRLAATY